MKTRRRLLKRVVKSIFFILLLILVVNEIMQLDDSKRLFSDHHAGENMTSKWNGIVWPSMGYPEIFKINRDSKDGLDVYLSYHSENGLRDESIKGELIPIHKESKSDPIDLTLTSIKKLSINEVDHLGKLSSWVSRHTPFVYHLSFGIERDEVMQHVESVLCDLRLVVAGQEIKQYNSVLIRNKEDGGFKFAFLSDIHVATRWDEIEKNVQHFFQKCNGVKEYDENIPETFQLSEVFTSDCFSKSYVNPNKVLSKLISRLNQLFDQGKLDFIVMGGDIVDYKFKKVRNESGDMFADTEWSFFESIILGDYPDTERLRVPIFMLTGNHDYRLYPYSLQIYGLRHCGISDLFTTEYLKRIGRYRKFKYRLSELDSIRINTGKKHSLDYYYRKFNSFDDYQFTYAGVNFFCLDTGADNFCYLSNILTSRRGFKFIKTLFGNIEQPKSIAYDMDQVQYFINKVGEVPDNDPIVVCTHAPIFNNSNTELIDFPDHETRLPFKFQVLNKDESLKRANRMQFEELLAANDLDVGGVYKNQLPILTSLLSKKNQTLFMAGHVHHHVEFGVEKTSGQLYHYRYSGSPELEDLLTSRLVFMQGAALGHVERGYQEGTIPSYRIIDVRDNKIKSVQYMRVQAEPFNQVYYNNQFEKHGMSEYVRIQFSKGSSLVDSEASLLHKVVILVKGNGALLEDLEVRTVPEGDVLEMKDVPDNADYQYYAMVSANQNESNFEIQGRDDNVKLLFAVESFVKTADGYRSLGLTLLQRELSNHSHYISSPDERKPESRH